MPDPSNAPTPASVGLDPVIRALIRSKAGRLVRSKTIRRQDADDFEHDLILAILARLRSFDPAQGTLGGFARTVVDSQAANLLRDRQAAKRDPRRTAPPGQDREADPRHPSSPDEVRSVDLRLDLADLLARLTPDQQALVEALRTGTMAEAGRLLGVPRTTLYETLRAVRRRLESAGLRDYLHNPSDRSRADRVGPE